ncbi:MAG: dihydrodipicolinate reductase C-terminal domain-containing protein [Flavobacteriales bacterium]|jgi:4-hydroxy-tetrahydrodipicolinate reductase|nr:dihydrodipicolinate reductase C-terminal domain-containing protein [Flavobacteriales bacterium]
MNIAIFGDGKMGKLISNLATERGHSIVLKANSKNPATSFELSDVDVAIDFSIPDTAFDNISHALQNKTPVISGTTNWLDKLEEIKEICSQHNGSFLYSSNFSLGMNIFFKLNQKLAELMKNRNYDVSINETHHIDKLDSPSGTAISLSNDLEKIFHDKTSITSNRISQEIGTHKINYSSIIDEIEITHKAKLRDGFALGALLAAEWIKNKKGVFTMEDVIR